MPTVCGARYKTRPGLTYHYTHSHKEGRPSAVSGGDEEASQDGPPPSPANKEKSLVVPPGAPGLAPSANMTAQSAPAASTNTASAVLPPSAQAGKPAEQGPGWGQFQDSYLTFLNAPGMLTPSLSLSACFFEPSLLFFDCRLFSIFLAAFCSCFIFARSMFPNNLLCMLSSCVG